MDLSRSAKLCSELLVDLDHIRFDLHDIQVAVATKELKSGEAKDLEFGIDYINNLIADAQKISKKIDALRDDLNRQLKPKEKTKKLEEEDEKREFSGAVN